MVILGIVLFILLIVLHEYGHFLVAKRNGVEVKEFGLGFPPKLWGKTLGRGIFRGYYSVNLLPLGGFVKLKGEHDSSEGRGTYGGCSLWVKSKILLAGVAVNFLTAVVLFTVMAVIGMPRLLPNSQFADEQFSLASDTHIVEEKVLVAAVLEDSPADNRLQRGDQILMAGQTGGQQIEIRSAQILRDKIRDWQGKSMELMVLRDGQRIQVTVSLQTEAERLVNNRGYSGIVPADYIRQRNTWSAPLTGIVLTGQFTKVTLQGLGQLVVSLFSGQADEAKDFVTGPVGIFFILKHSAQQGLSIVLMIIALLSLALGIMNALPIPALDGGRLVMTLFSRKVLRRPLSQKVEGRIVAYSMVALIALSILVTYIDVQRFF